MPRGDSLQVLPHQLPQEFSLPLNYITYITFITNNKSVFTQSHINLLRIQVSTQNFHATLIEYLNNVKSTELVILNYKAHFLII